MNEQRADGSYLYLSLLCLFAAHVSQALNAGLQLLCLSGDLLDFVSHLLTLLVDLVTLPAEKLSLVFNMSVYHIYVLRKYNALVKLLHHESCRLLTPLKLIPQHFLNMLLLHLSLLLPADVLFALLILLHAQSSLQLAFLHAQVLQLLLLLLILSHQLLVLLIHTNHMDTQINDQLHC